MKITKMEDVALIGISLTLSAQELIVLATLADCFDERLILTEDSAKEDNAKVLEGLTHLRNNREDREDFALALNNVCAFLGNITQNVKSLQEAEKELYGDVVVDEPISPKFHHTMLGSDEVAITGATKDMHDENLVNEYLVSIGIKDCQYLRTNAETSANTLTHVYFIGKSVV